MSEKPESHVAPAGGQRGRSWLAERLSLETFRYPVPAHANGFFYTLGKGEFICFVWAQKGGRYVPA